VATFKCLFTQFACSRWSHLYNLYDLGEPIERVRNTALVFEQCRFAKTSNVFHLWHGR